MSQRTFCECLGSCNGLLFYGSSRVMRLALSAGQSSNLHDIVRIFRQESVIHDNLQEEMLRIVLKRFIMRASFSGWGRRRKRRLTSSGSIMCWWTGTSRRRSRCRIMPIFFAVLPRHFPICSRPAGCLPRCG